MRYWKNLSLPEILLRIAIAFAFIYPAFAAIGDAYSWVGYFPSFLLNAVSPHATILLHAFGVLEVVLAVWILFGRRILVPSGIAVFLLLLIVAFNPSQFPILFRDIALAFAAGALVAIERAKHGRA